MKRMIVYPESIGGETISEMENGKPPVWKETAKKFGKALDMNQSVSLSESVYQKRATFKNATLFF